MGGTGGPQSPCYNCDRRYIKDIIDEEGNEVTVTCHSTCIEYQEFKKARDHYSKVKREYESQDYILSKRPWL